ncbi:MAG: DUF4982 domain-containing protein, partial [Verrucomicrobia bacterium]
MENRFPHRPRTLRARLHLAVLALLAMVAPAFSPLHAATETHRLSEGWRFARGPQPEAAAAPDFDDTGWTAVRVPHDWAIAGPFDPAAHGSTGKLPWKGEGWYRHTFRLPAARIGSCIYLEFDGVMAFPTIFVNGHRAGAWDYGYTSFRIDATPWVRWGEDNTLAVHVDTRRWGSRWYPGAGIYRKVRLVITEPLHIGHWGVQVRTNGDERQGIRPDTATVATTVVNHRDTAAACTVAVTILDPAGRAVASADAPLTIPAGGTATASASLHVDHPQLWDIDSPHLYRAHLSLRADGRETDTVTVRFGFRTFAFTADDGFHLNGRRVQLRGVNLHHDLGPLGAAFNRRAAQRQLEIMQAMGVNALRTSHNPPAPEVLDLCDEMGILVWDEVFDKYDATAGRPDLQPPLPAFSRRHIHATVRRDFNHPSIVVWSTGNEVSGDPAVEGITPERVAMMADFVREIDTTRPVGQGCHIPSLVDGRNFAALDLTGWNYARRYMNYRRQWPDRPIVYSESASTVSTRGYYEPDLPLRPTERSPTLQVSSYDLNAADWSDIPDVEFARMEQDRFVAGEFVWTGFDYLGEPTPFDAQARSSYFGIVDLCGFPKDRYYLYKSYWRPDETTVHILPHWNWPERIGKTVPVFVYTNGDSAELFLNGVSLGRRHKGERPTHPPDLARDAAVAASSEAPGHVAAGAIDTDADTLWRPAESDASPWLALDLGQARPVRRVMIETVNKENDYSWVLETSADGTCWTVVAEKAMAPVPRWSGPVRAFQDIDVTTRHIRLRFTGSQREAPWGLRRLALFAERSDNDYYDVTYDYRLRWNDVIYQPGELRAVAYRDGRIIGEATVRTAGAPAALRVSADRTALAA